MGLTGRLANWGSPGCIKAEEKKVFSFANKSLTSQTKPPAHPCHPDLHIITGSCSERRTYRQHTVSTVVFPKLSGLDGGELISRLGLNVGLGGRSLQALMHILVVLTAPEEALLHLQPRWELVVLAPAPVHSREVGLDVGAGAQQVGEDAGFLHVPCNTNSTEKGGI